MAVPADKWHSYISEIYRVLKPGFGWVQMVEYDRDVGRLYSHNPIPENSPLSKVSTISLE